MRSAETNMSTSLLKTKKGSAETYQQRCHGLRLRTVKTTTVLTEMMNTFGAVTFQVQYRHLIKFAAKECEKMPSSRLISNMKNVV